VATCGRESNLRPNARLPPTPAGTSYTTTYSCRSRRQVVLYIMYIIRIYVYCIQALYIHLRVSRYKLHIPTTYCSFYYCVITLLLLLLLYYDYDYYLLLSSSPSSSVVRSKYSHSNITWHTRIIITWLIIIPRYNHIGRFYRYSIILL